MISGACGADITHSYNQYFVDNLDKEEKKLRLQQSLRETGFLQKIAIYL